MQISVDGLFCKQYFRWSILVSIESLLDHSRGELAFRWFLALQSQCEHNILALWKVRDWIYLRSFFCFLYYNSIFRLWIQMKWKKTIGKINYRALEKHADRTTKWINEKNQHRQCKQKRLFLSATFYSEFYSNKSYAKLNDAHCLCIWFEQNNVKMKPLIRLEYVRQNVMFCIASYSIENWWRAFRTLT